MSAKIFLSWSGEMSGAIAKKFKEHLVTIFGRNVVDSFMSEEDIKAGDRGLDVISKTLEDCNAGIFFLTPENCKRPWIHFEAGAIAKKMKDSRVMVLLIDMQQDLIADTPLIQFQYKKFNTDGIKEIIKGVAVSCDAPEDIDTYYKRLEPAWIDMQGTFEEMKNKMKVDNSLDSGDDTHKQYDAIVEMLGDVRNRISSSNAHTLNEILQGINNIEKGFSEITYKDVEFMKYQRSNSKIVASLYEFMEIIDEYIVSLDPNSTNTSDVVKFLRELEQRISGILDAVR